MGKRSDNRKEGFREGYQNEPRLSKKESDFNSFLEGFFGDRSHTSTDRKSYESRYDDGCSERKAGK